jgi:EAL domain-containing protein (putative c-di-GMP-specific phosphodiesterase class I)/CheY-like chemotaxis protein
MKAVGVDGSRNLRDAPNAAGGSAGAIAGGSNPRGAASLRLVKKDGTDSDARESKAARILIVEDERLLLGSMARVLRDAGHEPCTAESGREAVALLDAQSFDAIVSDIKMPEMDGIQLLRVVRERDNEVPVVLMTGAPDLTTAMDAVSFGALQYLQKPFDLDELKKVVARAVQLCRMARIKKEALLLVGAGGFGASDRAGLEVTFQRALETLWMAYQPVVRASDRSLFGYEALLRTDEPALSTPLAVLDAAQRLGRLADLGRKVRAAAAGPVPSAPADSLIFVNLHAADLNDRELASPDSPLGEFAHRVVLEITERASLDVVADPRARIAELRSMGYRIAIDDLGAGYAGLTSFATMEPQFAKLDVTLIHDIDKDRTKQRLVRSMTALCTDLGIISVAEGIETASERDTAIELGCDLLQGFRFAKPGAPFPPFAW